MFSFLAINISPPTPLSDAHCLPAFAIIAIFAAVMFCRYRDAAFVAHSVIFADIRH
jgi:hypothetical protein